MEPSTGIVCVRCKQRPSFRGGHNKEDQQCIFHGHETSNGGQALAILRRGQTQRSRESKNPATQSKPTPTSSSSPTTKQLDRRGEHNDFPSKGGASRPPKEESKSPAAPQRQRQQLLRLNLKKQLSAEPPPPESPRKPDPSSYSSSRPAGADEPEQAQSQRLLPSPEEKEAQDHFQSSPMPANASQFRSKECIRKYMIQADTWAAHSRIETAGENMSHRYQAETEAVGAENASGRTCPTHAGVTYSHAESSDESMQHLHQAETGLRDF